MVSNIRLVRIHFNLLVTCLCLSLYFTSEFKLTDAHEVTVKAGQDNPHGQEIENIDQSIIGQGVTIERTKGNGKEADL